MYLHLGFLIIYRFARSFLYFTFCIFSSVFYLVVETYSKYALTVLLMP
jgi:hypothetical protein